MAILDTNIIVRYVSRDDPDKAARALAYFEQLEAGRQTVSLSEAVLVETVQVLSSSRLYAMLRETIRTRLRTIIMLSGVRLTNKGLYLRALDLYVSYAALSFVDALLACRAEREPPATVVSFDRGFDRLPNITRVEP